MNYQAISTVSLLLALAESRSEPAHAQLPPNLPPDQLMQLMRSQPSVDLSAPVSARAVFDPPQVHPGEKAVYRVTFNSTAVSVNWSENIPMSPALHARLNATGQTMLPGTVGFENFATFDYDVRADVPGEFTVPEFTVQVYGKPVVVPAARLTVKTDLPEPHEPLRQLFITASKTNVFLGENLDVSVILPATSAGSVDGVSDVHLNGEGFVVDNNSARQSIQTVQLNDRSVLAYVHKTSLTPIAAGKLQLSAQGFCVQMQPGGPPSAVLLDSEPVVLDVRPLPGDKELPGFQGAVGDFTADPPYLTTNRLTVGEPLRLTMVVRGKKNLDRVVPPPPPAAPGWQIFPAGRGHMVGGLKGPGTSFQYNLIPLTTNVNATPVIPFCYFNPASGDYVDLSIPALPVTVVETDAGANAAAAWMSSAADAEPDLNSGLSKLASSPGWAAGGLVPWQLHRWFPLVQIFPAFVFCGLWFWDRRRQHFERHPEIVRRRLARRALRRESRLVERAAKRGELDNFVRRAVSALQIASAPHYPATPRALVCGDVLNLLTAAEREGKFGETVRRFFAAADAAAFANRVPDPSQLLAAKPALIELMREMEARL